VSCSCLSNCSPSSSRCLAAFDAQSLEIGPPTERGERAASTLLPGFGGKDIVVTPLGLACQRRVRDEREAAVGRPLGFVGDLQTIIYFCDLMLDDMAFCLAGETSCF